MSWTHIKAQPVFTLEEQWIFRASNGEGMIPACALKRDELPTSWRVSILNHDGISTTCYNYEGLTLEQAKAACVEKLRTVWETVA